MHLNYDTSALTTYDDNTLTITFTPPVIVRNGMNIAPLLNPRIETELRNNTLLIRYTYDDKYVVAVGAWQFAQQFNGIKASTTNTAEGGAPGFVAVAGE